MSGIAPTQPDRPAGAELSIAALEYETGIGKDTLRVWERRYGFPRPGRDGNGERVYPPDQVARLRLIARLLSRGMRPGRLVGLDESALQELARSSAPAPSPAVAAGTTRERADLLALLRRHDITALRRSLQQAAVRMGLGSFVRDLVAPLTHEVGEAWMRGDIQMFEEHMYTECLLAQLRAAVSALGTQNSSGQPRVLLTTLPQEPHGLGLLMAETLLALEGCECVPLGVQTPILEIARAAQANRADIVALSFSPLLPGQQVLQGLAELRQVLPARVALWAGGSHPILRRPLPDGVTAVTELGAIAPLLASRPSHPPP